jgi:hypothetical protein
MSVILKYYFVNYLLNQIEHPTYLKAQKFTWVFIIPFQRDAVDNIYDISLIKLVFAPLQNLLSQIFKSFS